MTNYCSALEVVAPELYLKKEITAPPTLETLEWSTNQDPGGASCKTPGLTHGLGGGAVRSCLGLPAGEIVSGAGVRKGPGETRGEPLQAGRAPGFLLPFSATAWTPGEGLCLETAKFLTLFICVWE